MESVIEAEKEVIRQKIGPSEHVICALSGGVDSTVAATLVHSVIGDRLHCVFVDNGLLRYKEGERVTATFKEHLHLPVTKVDAKAEMMSKLEGVTDPEAKRKAIGREFIECFMRFRCALSSCLCTTCHLHAQLCKREFTSSACACMCLRRRCTKVHIATSALWRGSKRPCAQRAQLLLHTVLAPNLHLPRWHAVAGTMRTQLLACHEMSLHMQG